MKEMSRRRSKAYRDAPSRTSRPDEFMELTPSKSTTSNPSPRSSTLRSCRNAELAVERSSTPPILTVCGPLGLSVTSLTRTSPRPVVVTTPSPKSRRTRAALRESRNARWSPRSSRGPGRGSELNPPMDCSPSYTTGATSLSRAAKTSSILLNGVLPASRAHLRDYRTGSLDPDYAIQELCLSYLYEDVRDLSP